MRQPMRSLLALILGLCAAIAPLHAYAQVGIGDVQIGVPRTGPILDPVLDDVSRVTSRLGPRH
jgi:hypothetical protein